MDRRHEPSARARRACKQLEGALRRARQHRLDRAREQQRDEQCGVRAELEIGIEHGRCIVQRALEYVDPRQHRPMVARGKEDHLDQGGRAAQSA